MSIVHYVCENFIMKNYYHLFANGEDARDYILSESDFVYAMNLVAICSYENNVRVLAFSIEETHPHMLLYGDDESCHNFAEQFKDSTIRHVYQTRGSIGSLKFNCVLLLITDKRYLMNTAAYVIIQPTKDGKPVMFYDYPWGSGSLYFRTKSVIPLWFIRKDGTKATPQKMIELSSRVRHDICGRHSVPDDWLVADGLILPANYVDVKMYQDIFKTLNTFRVFVASSNAKLEPVQNAMANARGVLMDDMEARELTRDTAMSMFQKNLKSLSIEQRISLARVIRKDYGLSLRQIARMIHIPELELQKYIS